MGFIYGNKKNTSARQSFIELKLASVHQFAKKLHSQIMKQRQNNGPQHKIAKILNISHLQYITSFYIKTDIIKMHILSNENLIRILCSVLNKIWVHQSCKSLHSVFIFTKYPMFFGIG